MENNSWEEILAIAREKSLKLSVNIKDQHLETVPWLRNFGAFTLHEIPLANPSH